MTLEERRARADHAADMYVLAHVKGHAVVHDKPERVEACVKKHKGEK